MIFNFNYIIICKTNNIVQIIYYKIKIYNITIINIIYIRYMLIIYNIIYNIYVCNNNIVLISWV